MEKESSLLFFDQRQMIHDLTLTKHSGLSPPELELLDELEAKELLDTRSNEFAPG